MITAQQLLEAEINTQLKKRLNKYIGEPVEPKILESIQQDLVSKLEEIRNKHEIYYRRC